MTDNIIALPRSWSEAKEKRAKWYCTGKPCPKCGDVDARRFPSGECRICLNAKNRIRVAALKRQRKAEREAARAAEKAAQEEARLAMMAEEGTETVLGREEAERLAADEARRERARESSRKSRMKRMEVEGTEAVREDERQQQRECYARTRHVRQAKRRERTARGVAGYRMIRLRTPPWLSDEELADIGVIYDDRNEGEEVDHIVPIDSHPELAGLHVPWNLRVITVAKNRQRSQGRVNEFRCTPEEAADYVARGMAVWKEDVAEDGTIDWHKYPRPKDR